MRKLNITKNETGFFQGEKRPGISKVSGWPLLLLLFMLIARGAYAQAPAISYTTPQTYKQGQAITPLTPTASGVAPFAYSNTSVDTGLGFGFTAGVVFDSNGNMFTVPGRFSSPWQTRVEEFPADGSAGFYYGPVFLQVTGITMDANNNLYVADRQAGTVFKIPAGGGTAIPLSYAAKYPTDMAADRWGNVYVLDDQLSTLWKISPSGSATIFYGPISEAYEFGGVAVDASGYVYLTNRSGRRLSKFFPSGAPDGTTDMGTSPYYGLVVDPGYNTFVCEQFAIAMFPASNHTTVTIASNLANPVLVTLDNYGNLYEVESAEGRITKINRTGGYFISPALPPGLSLDENTGTISGTPTASSPPTNYTVTAYNGTSRTQATVNISVAPESVDLSGLTISAGALNPVFNADSIHYTVAEASTLDTLVVKPSAADLTSTIRVNGTAVTSGHGISIPLGYPVTNISIVVTGAGNLLQKAYTLMIGRGSHNANLAALNVKLAPLSPAFASASTDYTSVVASYISTTTVTARVAQSGSAITVNGVAVTSGAASPPITLNPGSNIIKTVVTAPDGVTRQTYTVTVTRGNPPAILTSEASGNISACTGSPSASPAIQKITASGNHLFGNITIVAPTNFEVSLSPGSGYARQVSLTQTAGVANSAVIYVRSAATAPAGNISGTVVFTSFGATAQNVTVTGNINLVPTVDPVADVTVMGSITTAPIDFTGANASITWTNSNPKIGLPASGNGNIAPFAPVNDGNAPVTATVTVRPVSAPLAYMVTNSGLVVMNTIYNTKVATVNMGQETPTGGVAVSPNGGKVYVACVKYANGTFTGGVAVISTATNTMVGLIAVGQTPSGIVISADGGRVYVANSNSNTVSVIDAGTDTLVGSIATGNVPVNLALTADGSILYVVNSSGTISVINTATNTMVNLISLDAVPTAVTVSPDGTKLYVSFASSPMETIDPTTGMVIHKFPDINGAAQSVFSPDGSRLYVVNTGAAAIRVINTATNTSSYEPVSFFHYISGISLSADGSILYVSIVAPDEIAEINTSTYTVLGYGPAANDINAKSYGNFVTPGTGCSGPPAKFTITVNPAGDDRLSSLRLSAGDFSPGFSSEHTIYTAKVVNGVTSVTVTPTTDDPAATVTVNGIAVTSGTPSAPITLNVGADTLTVVVTASDGISKKTYTVVETRAPSSDADLVSLKLSAGILSPSFNETVTSYTATVGYGVAAVQITPTAVEGTLVGDIFINVNTVGITTSGVPTRFIKLNIGPNIFDVIVTAPDHITKKTYRIVVTRLTNADELSGLKVSRTTLSPAFRLAVSDYTATVLNTVGSVTVTPTLEDNTASVTVNGTAATSGSATGPITLSVGVNAITIVVTAADGVTTRTYTVTITRGVSSNANLSALAISRGTLSPAFTGANTSYTASVVNGVTSVTIAPTTANSGATVTVNGTAVTSGSASGAIPLDVGSNTITTVVTAQDGTTTNTYSIVFNRAAGPVNIPDASLSVIQQPTSPPIEDDVIIVHQGLSPNGDGINDFLQIDGIQAYPDNKLSIMNRNGQLVYEAKGYDNTSKVFDGHSNKTGQMQLPGTYFYSLEYTAKGVVKHKTGYLVMKY